MITTTSYPSTSLAASQIRIETGADLSVSRERPVADAGAELSWTMRMIRFGVACTLPFQATHLAVILWVWPWFARAVAPVLLGDLALTAILLGWSCLDSFQRHWRLGVFGWCSGLVISAALIAIITSQITAFAVAIVLMLFGTAAFAGWGARWQAAFVIVCMLTAGAVAVYGSRPADVYEPFRMLEFGTAAAMSLFVTALTDRYRREVWTRLEVVRDNEERLWRIFEANPDAIAVADLQTGEFLQVSEQFLTSGFKRKEVLGATDLALGIWVDESLRAQFWEKMRGEGFIRNLEARFRLKDGVIVACLISGVRVDLGRGPSVIMVLRNIERLKRTERALNAAREAAESASRAKSDFLSSMSHEIRTPMNAILGMAEVLADSPLSPEQRKYLSIMINNGGALLDLINDILDLARVESGRLKLERTPFDLYDLVERVGETLSIRAHKKKLDLIVAIAPELPARVIGDPLRLRQILINLIGNAIKFTEQGEIVVEVGQPEADGLINFVVRDTGIGIPRDQLEQIFTSYAQAEASTARKYGGTGLGLAIVKQLTELMGGSIWVVSEPGCGSEFHFKVRLEINPAGAKVRDSTIENTPVLVADGSTTSRETIVRTLAAHGALVDATSDWNTVNEWLKRHRGSRSAVLLDCNSMGIGGEEESLPIIDKEDMARIVAMVTSDDLNLKVPRLSRLGFLRHLIKPVKHTEMLEALESASAPHAQVAEINADKTRGETANVVSAEDKSERAFKLEPLTGGLPFGRAIHVLVADDSEDNRLLIDAFLKKTGCSIDQAENGEVAVRKFKESHYDVVLMDIQMPVMDGYRAVREIREWEKAEAVARTPVIALTASVLDEAVGKSFDAGCDTHVSKPVRRGTLVTAIREVVKVEPAQKIAV